MDRFTPSLVQWQVNYKMDKVIRIEKDSYNRDIKIYLCTICKKKEIRVRDKTHTRQCMSCSRHGIPYLSHYKNIFHDFRQTGISLTFEEYLEFTKINECHYCDSLINWLPHNEGNKKVYAYYLDRKDNDGPYSKDNCVVCCTRCNRMRSNKFTYDEFILFKPVLKEIETKRKQNV